MRDDCCNDPSITRVDLSRFQELREFVVGVQCFKYVRVVNISGLRKLEKVKIGDDCFSAKEGNWIEYSPNHSFYLRDCPFLKELSIGDRSFIEYSTCIIENVPSICSIALGGLSYAKGWHGCFLWSSIELRGR